MVTVIVRWKVPESDFKTVITLLKELRAFTLKEEGNISYDTYRGEDPDFDLLLHEQYVTSAALELHRQSIYFNNLFSEEDRNF